MKFIFSNYDSPGNPYYGGGGAVAIHHIARSLTSHHQVTVLVGAYPSSQNQLIENVSYRFIGAGWLGSYNQLIYILILPLYVMTSKFDLWVESFIPPFSSTFVPFWTRRPVVGFAQLLNAHDFSKKYFYLPFPLVERWAISHYTHIIALSQSVAHTIKNISQTCNVKIFSLGYDSFNLITQAPKNRSYFLYLGRIDLYQKGLDLLLISYHNAHIQIPLKIAGSGIESEENKLRKMIIELGLSKLVRIVGYVSGQRKSKLLANAIATIIPSRYETFSLTALESLAHGTPVIYSDLPDLRWIPLRSGVKFDFKQPELLGDILSNFPKFKSKNIDTPSILMRSVKRYSWSSLIPKYTEYLIDLGDKHD